MKKLAVLLAAAPLLLCAPLASSADASSAGDPGAFVLSEAEVDQMARNTHDFNQAIAAGNAADVRRLLSTGITPNIVLENGDTPLTCAASRGISPACCSTPRALTSTWRTATARRRSCLR